MKPFFVPAEHTQKIGMTILVVMLGGKIIKPKSLQKRLLSALHSSGTRKTETKDDAKPAFRPLKALFTIK